MNSMLNETTSVRAGEEIDAGALSAYLAGRIEGIEHGIVIEQFRGGHSNLTYLLRINGKELVLRRAPLGPVAPKAHDMVREARVLEAVHPHFRPAPEVYLICENAEIIGAPFFLMERRRGIVLRDQIPPMVAVHHGYARRISRAVVDCLVAMHSIDVEKTGLIALGKPDGFVARQVKGWSERWERARTEPSPAMDRVMAWLASTIPPSGRPTLVHNDFKLDNVMLDARSPDRIDAVLDWEMTAIGDPLCDLGLTLCYWSSAVVPGTGHEALTAGPGWYTRDDFVAHYQQKTGRDLSALRWHEVLGVFKLAVILQQIYFRYWKGQTADERFSKFDERVQALTRLAAELVEKAR
ncbi:MAG TPA: phosphotransferase family protein [Bryobacteraceae bacterium]|nr:phosphotransferase family protein [Bryobacteraceae bacterium]